MTLSTRFLPRAAQFHTALAVVLATGVLALLAWLGPSWLRLAFAVAWFLLIPGLPWALHLRLADLGDTVAVLLAVSMGLTAIVGGVMALLAVWSPVLGVGVLGGQALVGALLRPAAQLRHRRTRVAKGTRG